MPITPRGLKLLNEESTRLNNKVRALIAANPTVTDDDAEFPDGPDLSAVKGALKDTKFAFARLSGK